MPRSTGARPPTSGDSIVAGDAGLVAAGRRDERRRRLPIRIVKRTSSFSCPLLAFVEPRLRSRAAPAPTKPFIVLGELQRRLRCRAASRPRRRPRAAERHAVRAAPRAGGLDALVHRLGHPVAREVEEVVDRHLGFDQLQRDLPAELAGLSGRDLALFSSSRCQIVKKLRVGRRLDDVEVLRDEAVDATRRVVLTVQIAQISSAPRRIGFLHVGVADVHRVDVGVAVDDDRRKPHRQRDRATRLVFGHHRRWSRPRGASSRN